MTTPRGGLRRVLAGTACVHPASVFDAPSARLAESLGFSCGIYAGSVASLSVLGAPDLILLTLSEFAEQARRICRATALPLLVDADHGYGNALNVMRCVQELEAAGVAGLTIEDTELPPPYGAAAPRLVSRAESRDRLRAALAARHDPALVIIGRTGALGIAGLEEAVARAAAFAEAGADGVLLTGVTGMAQVERVAAAVSCPLLLGAAAPGLESAALARAGVRFRILGHHPYLAALNAAYEALRAVHLGEREPVPGLPDALLAVAENRRAWTAARRDFLGPGAPAGNGEEG